MKKTTTALVIPSNRPHALDTMLEAWDHSGTADWDMLVVVYDAPEAGPHGDIRLCHADLDRLPHPMIAKHSAQIRIAGYLAAIEHGADYIVTLDDDCYPAPNPKPFCARHRTELNPPTAHSVLNTPFLLDEYRYRLRGLPHHQLRRRRTTSGPALNVGLWYGDADYSANTDLARRQSGHERNDHHHLLRPVWQRNEAIPAGRLSALSGMNLAFHRRDAEYAWQPPTAAVGWPRYDDIWGGLLAQCMAYANRRAITFGAPYCDHRRASDPHANLLTEALGLTANEQFWRLATIFTRWLTHVPKTPQISLTTLANMILLAAEHMDGRSTSIDHAIADAPETPIHNTMTEADRLRYLAAATANYADELSCSL